MGLRRGRCAGGRLHACSSSRPEYREGAATRRGQAKGGQTVHRHRCHAPGRVLNASRGHVEAAANVGAVDYARPAWPSSRTLGVPGSSACLSTVCSGCSVRDGALAHLGPRPRSSRCPAPGRHPDRRRGGAVCALPTLPIRFNPAMPQRPRRQGGAASDRRGGLLDVEVDAEEQERPQDDCQQR